MNIRHREEWSLLIKLAQESSLSKERIRFLLALREVVSLQNEERKTEGFEYGVKAAKGTTLEEQAKWAIGTIKANEKRYQDHIIKHGYIEYPNFFTYLGGPYGTGWNKSNPVWFVDNLNIYIKLIEEEL